MQSLPIYNSVQRYLNLFINEYCYPHDRLLNDWTSWITSRNDSEQSAKDFIWGMFNTFIMRISQNASSEKELYNKQTKIAWDMLTFLSDEGRDTRNVRSMLNTLSLQTAKLDELKLDAEIVSNRCCEECAKINGKKYSLDDALRVKPIPYSDCIRPGGCNCLYSYTEKRDRGGRLLFNDSNENSFQPKQRKPYNPNTAYGRRKLREQAQAEYEKKTPAQKTEHTLWVWIIGIVICVVIYLLLGRDGFLKWGQR